MIETIRPRMSMVKDLLPGMKESWIFNDCAIGETKDGQFIALIIRWLPEAGEYYYGFVPNLRLKNTSWTTRDLLENACGMFADCPAVFYTEPTWENVKEGHRYA